MISINQDQLRVFQGKINYIQRNLKYAKGEQERQALQGTLTGLRIAAHVFRCEILLKLWE